MVAVCVCVGGGAGKTSSITSKHGVRRPVLPYARPPLTSNRSESSFVGEGGEKKVSQMDYCVFFKFYISFSSFSFESLCICSRVSVSLD